MDIKKLNLNEEFFNRFKYNDIKDDLTNAISRKYFVEYIDYLISNKISFNLISFDIDKLKIFNDDNDYKIGDLLIKKLMDIISNYLDTYSSIGRLDGDEVSIIIKGEFSYDEKWSLLRRIHQETRKPIKILDKEYLITLTSGLVAYPENANDTESLLRLLDKSIYRGKTKGGNCYIIYSNTRHKELSLKPDISMIEKINKIKGLFIDFKNKDILLDSLSLIKDLINNSDGAAFYFKHKLIQSNDLIMNLNNLDIELIDELYPLGFIKVNAVSELDNDSYLYQYLNANNIKAAILIKTKLKKETGYLMVYSRHNKRWNENGIVLAQCLSDYLSFNV